MLKFAGCAVTVFCSAVWGYEKSRSLNRSLQLAISLTALVKRIGNDIDTLKKPLNDIYADYVDELLEEAGFLADLRERGFREALEKVKKSLPDGAYDVLYPFAVRIGGMDKETESALCRGTAANLEGIINAAKEKMPEKTKMYRLLPVLCALSVVILII